MVAFPFLPPKFNRSIASILDPLPSNSFTRTTSSKISRNHQKSPWGFAFKHIDTPWRPTKWLLYPKSLLRRCGNAHHISSLLFLFCFCFYSIKKNTVQSSPLTSPKLPGQRLDKGSSRVKCLNSNSIHSPHPFHQRDSTSVREVGPMGRTILPKCSKKTQKKNCLRPKGGRHLKKHLSKSRSSPSSLILLTPPPPLPPVSSQVAQQTLRVALALGAILQTPLGHLVLRHSDVAFVWHLKTRSFRIFLVAGVLFRKTIRIRTYMNLLCINASELPFLLLNNL